MAPKLAAFDDRITQNPALFSRIEAVYKGPQYKTLTPEQQRLTWETWNNFVRVGRAARRCAARSACPQINQRLATLFTTFSNNLLADEEGHVTWLDADQIGGLPPAGASRPPPGRRRSAAARAPMPSPTRARPWSHSSRIPSNRKLREQVWRTYYNRGDNGDAHDNNAIIREILKLRAERATMLGYPTHAHWRLEVAMARTPENAMKLMDAVWPAAIARVKEEVADMQAIADKEAAAGGEKIGDRGLGLPLLRRESAHGAIQPRCGRSAPVPAARQAARRHVLGRRRAVRSGVHARRPACPCTSRT